ncbi:MAG: CPBP family intramembrane metalloprotease [Clostridiales bacterium]|nr:CPBP family intramembrane metalloprotease [Clostridiales bacterium]MCF8021820.1 CPBP family intramembrane metalloprotease [Clostridiales bacterium]
MKFDMELTRKNLIMLSILFSLVLIILSFFIKGIYLKENFNIFTGNLLIQLIIGITYGIAAGSISLFLLIKLKIFKELKSLFQELIIKTKITMPVILFISISAGISEELMFRGVLQQLIGIWWSSLMFIALHGYFNPCNWKITTYGLLMFSISLGLGLLYETCGLVSVISAHALVDIVIFQGLLVNVSESS